MLGWSGWLSPLRAGFRPLSRCKGRVGTRPSKASKAAICYVRRRVQAREVDRPTKWPSQTALDHANAL
jgi:hypothetical protein